MKGAEYKACREVWHPDMEVLGLQLLLRGGQGVISDRKICASRQAQVAAKKAIAFPDYINRSLVSRSMWLRMLLHSALVKQHLKSRGSYLAKTFPWEFSQM